MRKYYLNITTESLHKCDIHIDISKLTSSINFFKFDELAIIYEVKFYYKSQKQNKNQYIVCAKCYDMGNLKDFIWDFCNYFEEIGGKITNEIQ